MDNDLQTLRLLFIHDSADVAEQLINVLRNKGKATRAQLVESLPDFESQVEKKTWDVLLFKDQLDEYPAEKVVAVLKQHSKDIPIIALVPEYDQAKVLALQQLGVHDVVPGSEDQRLSIVITREVDNLQDRRRRRHLHACLLESEKRCGQLIKSSRDPVAYVAAGMHVYVNTAYLEFFGFEGEDDLEGVPILDLVASKHQSDMKAFLKQYVSGDGGENSITTLVCLNDDTQASVTMSFSQATYDGEVCTQLVIRLDDQEAELQDQLQKISQQDMLTGLYNRRYIIEVLTEVVERCKQQSETASLLYARVNRYLTMQAELGIANCDLVVNDAASQLQKLAPPGSVVGHFSDDVFALILPNFNREKTEGFIARLKDFFQGHLADVQGRSVPVQFSIGIVPINDSTDGPHEAIANAHAAASTALANAEQNAFETTIEYFRAPEIVPEELSKSDEISEQLQRAMENGMFKILFQPIISLRAQNQPFYEVLLRMIDDAGNEISPLQFIEAATSQKVTEKIDRWVVVQSIKALAARYAAEQPTRLIINITPQTLLDESFVPWLGMALKASRLPHDALVFQLPENEAYRYLKQAKETCKALSELHCKVSISRFGAISNAINLFRHLHVDYVKIDGSFTKGLGGDGDAAFSELIEQVHANGKMTIATFVEEVKVLSSLYGIGVNYIQGYYLQGPTENMDYDFSSEDD